MFIALMLALAIDATPQTAPPAEAPAKAPPAQAEKVPDDWICHMETATGSRFPKKVCRRKSEVDSKRADDQMNLRMHTRTWGQNGS